MIQHPIEHLVLLYQNFIGNFEGPGCSSIGQGAFGEHGPFKPTREGHPVKN
jgi:hypothetical protein